MNTILNKLTTVATTSNVDGVDAFNNLTDYLKALAPTIAILGVIIVGLTLIIGTAQMKETAKSNLLYIIAGIILISIAVSLVTELFV